MKLLKQVIGIDVAQLELVCCFAVLSDDLRTVFKSYATFKNNQKGFLKMVKWTKEILSNECDPIFVMEATGVYHEKFAYWLHKKSYNISIVLPNKISNYARSLEVRTVTDKTASEAIARFGIERNLDLWNPPRKIFAEMKQLTREREQIVSERTTIKNQIHAEKTEANPNKSSLKRLNQRLRLLNKQEKEIKIELEEIIKTDEELKNKVNKICTIPGIGRLTTAIILAETNGFELIKNKRQLTSYAGMDVKEKQSGTSVKGKPKISKRGNRYLRKAVYLPSLTAVKHNELHKETYARLVGRHGIKMKALVAIQRKLLELVYILFKNNTTYDNDYEEKRKALQEKTEPLESSLC